MYLIYRHNNKHNVYILLLLNRQMSTQQITCPRVTIQCFIYMYQLLQHHNQFYRNYLQNKSTHNEKYSFIHVIGSIFFKYYHVTYIHINIIIIYAPIMCTRTPRHRHAQQHIRSSLEPSTQPSSENIQNLASTVLIYTFKQCL